MGKVNSQTPVDTFGVMFLNCSFLNVQHEIRSHASGLISLKNLGSLYPIVYHNKNQVFFACNGHIFVFRAEKIVADARYFRHNYHQKTVINLLSFSP